MSEPKNWSSPDGRIKKEILRAGVFGAKPTENCICKIGFSNIEALRGAVHSEYLVGEEADTCVNIGESNTWLDREVDKCLMSMHSEESSRFVVSHAEGEACFTLTLREFESRGYIYEWNAVTKLRLAQAHKEKGVLLFKEGRHVDASHRFSRGLKLLLSVPESVEEVPEQIDGVARAELHNFRANLYNNLASCYLKVKRYEVVVSLCSRVLQIDRDNVRALHKRGVAHCDTHDYERAKADFERILELEPQNKAAIDKLQLVNARITTQEANYASIVKKMFAK